MICPDCHTEVGEKSKFCGRCGTAIPTAPMPAAAAQPPGAGCPRCGSPVAAGKRFCGACGAPAGREAAPSPPAVPARETLNPPVAPRATPGPPPPRAAPAARPSPGPPLSPPAPPAVPAPLESEKAGRRLSRGGVATLAALLILLLAAATWYTLGVELDVSSNPGDAEVMVDGKIVGATGGQGISLSVPHLQRRAHVVTLIRQGYQPWSQQISLGFFEFSHHLDVSLPVPSYPLLVITTPGGAEVQLDGNDAGTSDPSGRLQIAQVSRGEHTLYVSHQGFPSSGEKFYVQSPLVIRADLASAAAAMQQKEAAELAQARALYRQRQFDAAIAECDAVLKLDPANRSAASLKQQVKQTKAILGGH